MFGWGTWKEAEDVPWVEREEDVHTPDHPYCGDLSCWCHTDVASHDQVTGPFSAVMDEQVAWAYRFFGVFRRELASSEGRWFLMKMSDVFWLVLVVVLIGLWVVFVLPQMPVLF